MTTRWMWNKSYSYLYTLVGVFVKQRYENNLLLGSRALQLLLLNIGTNHLHHYA